MKAVIYLVLIVLAAWIIIGAVGHFLLPAAIGACLYGAGYGHGKTIGYRKRRQLAR